jgi:tyrosine-protein kinase Etk/Wzc
MISNNGQSSHLQKSGHTRNEILRYLKIFHKKRWLIIITFFIVLLIWTAFTFFTLGRPKYTAQALVTFQKRSNVSGIMERRGTGGNDFSPDVLLKSNSLLKDVVVELQSNLSLETEDVIKDNVFKYLEVSAESTPGEYRLIKALDKYEIFFSDEERYIPEKKIVSFNSEDTVHINQFGFLVNHNFLENNNLSEIKFQVKRIENAIQQLKLKIAYRMDRRANILTISGIGGSPNGAAKLVNTVLSNYEKTMLDMKRYKINEVLQILEHELKITKVELDEANERSKKFREQFPWVVLKTSSSNLIGEINKFEGEKSAREQRIDDLEVLKNKVENIDEIEEKIIAAKELLTYLSSEAVVLATAFENQFNDLTAERQTLLTEYAPSHPFVVQNNRDLIVLIGKIRDTADEQIIKLKTRNDELTKSIDAQSYRLRRLPVKEIELAELTRDQELKESLYRNVLSKYNQKKIEHEVEVSDLVVIEKAMPPPVQGIYETIIKQMAIGFILALGMGFGLAFILEFFSKTVENVDDLQEKLKFPVIGSIPIIKNENGNSEDFTALKGKRDPKLITLDYSPTLESESYRDLRTKILYMNKNKTFSSFLLTSLQQNEGKSITSANIAITLAQQKITTLLIDGDLRRGVLHNVFVNDKKPGLSDFLVSRSTVDYNNLNKLIQSTFIPNLFLISAGTPLPNPTEMLGSDNYGLSTNRNSCQFN